MTTPSLPEMKLPEVKFNKNGYEIRSDILALAKEHVEQEYKARYAGWEVAQTRNPDGSLTTTVAMPEFPGLDKVLEAAEKMYGFVNQSQSKK